MFSVFCFSKRPPARHPEAARPPTHREIKNARPKLMTSSTALHTSRHSRCAAVHCHLPAATHNVRSHWMSPADGPASPSCTRAMPQAAAVAYTASTLGAAARCSKSTSFLPLMPLSRLVARHSRMLSRSYGGRVCGAVACVWPVLTRLLSVPCLGHKNRTRGAAQGPSKPRNRQMSQPGSPRAIV